MHTELEHNFANKTILIVEDEESNYALLEALLLPAGALLLHANTGQRALELIEENKTINIILMDIKLPDMNGYDLTIIIRKSGNNIPIIAQTAFAMSGDKTKALDAGCNAYISKPIDLFELMDIITGYIN